MTDTALWGSRPWERAEEPAYVSRWIGFALAWAVACAALGLILRVLEIRWGFWWNIDETTRTHISWTQIGWIIFPVLMGIGIRARGGTIITAIMATALMASTVIATVLFGGYGSMLP